MSYRLISREQNMLTTINIDTTIIDDLMHYTQINTPNQAVQIAITNYIAKQHLPNKQQLLNLRGTINITDNWQQLRGLEITE